MDLRELIRQNMNDGLSGQLAAAKVCQDIVIKAIAAGSLSRNVTVKGGVVMRSITQDLRRSTRDMDFDFIRYSLADDSIDAFIAKLNCLDGLTIARSGNIEELKHQDYHGKRVNITITDAQNVSIQSKLDIGVHKHFELEQEEYCFDLCMDNDCASILINSKEQIFAEKLRSLLVFGQNSSRYKDLYDLYYLKAYLNAEKLQNAADVLIFRDSLMREKTWADILRRVSEVFADKAYIRQASSSKQRWMRIYPKSQMVFWILLLGSHNNKK